MSLDEFLHDRQKMMKLFWLGFIGSLVLIGIGLVVILMQLLD